MLEFFRGGNHFPDTRVVADGCHAGARAHHVARHALIQADDLQDDFLFRFREGALLQSPCPTTPDIPRP